MKRNAPRDEFQRKRAERRRKIRRRRLTAFFVIFIILLLCVGAVLSFTVFFPIADISAAGSKIYTAEQILDSCGIAVGDNLFAVSKSKAELSVKKELPYVESITLKREIPDTLKITVKDATEFACYKVDKRYYTVSKSGWVLKEGKKASENLMTVIAKGVGCKVGSEIKFEDASQKELVNELEAALKTEGIKVNIIDVSSFSALKAKVEGRFTIDFGNANNLTEKVKHLNSMMEEIPKEKQGEIDLSMWTSDNTRGTFKAKNE